MNIKVTTRKLMWLGENAQAHARKGYHLPQATLDYHAKQLAMTVDAISAEREPMDTAIEAALAKVNGNADAHTITTATEVRQVATDAEEKLDRLGVTKKNRVGTICRYSPALKLPSAYGRKGRNVITTALTLKRVGDGWRLIKVERADVWYDSPGMDKLIVSANAADDIRRAAFVGIEVAP